MVASVLNMYILFFLVIPETMQYNDYLNRVYIVLGNICNPEMIENIWEDLLRICKYYISFYTGT